MIRAVKMTNDMLIYELGLRLWRDHLVMKIRERLTGAVKPRGGEDNQPAADVRSVLVGVSSTQLSRLKY